MTAPGSAFAPSWDGLLALRAAGGFGMLMVDPPWTFKARSPKGEGRSPQRHYACLPLPAIKAMPVGELAARDALLWLWATNPLLDRAFEVLAAWGFRFATAGTWGKVTPAGKPRIGGGYWLRGASEPFLLGVRGAPRVVDRAIPSLILAPRREHSRKPDEAYGYAERLAPGVRRLDLFARETRPGWTPWGDQAGRFDLAETATSELTP